MEECDGEGGRYRVGVMRRSTVIFCERTTNYDRCIKLCGPAQEQNVTASFAFFLFELFLSFFPRVTDRYHSLNMDRLICWDFPVDKWLEDEMGWFFFF